MTLVISRELEERLRTKAEAEACDVNSVAETLLAAALDWEAQDREEAIAGIRRGLEAGEAGRVRPAEDVFAEMRALIQQARL